jgi:hypothetical protein
MQGMIKTGQSATEMLAESRREELDIEDAKFASLSFTRPVGKAGEF